ncbi:MAG: hypothetical protein ACE5K1_02455, partial [Acidiferrobacterales bacterium]
PAERMTTWQKLDISMKSSGEMQQRKKRKKKKDNANRLETIHKRIQIGLRMRGRLYEHQDSPVQFGEAC